MAEAARTGDPEGDVMRIGDIQPSAYTWQEPRPANTRLPIWLGKELRRVGADAATIRGMDEETALDLVAEIRADAFE